MATSRILDPYGQPFRLKEITEPQTARLGHLRQEFASHPVRGLSPGKLARILEEAEQGDLRAQCDLFEDMEEKDGHIFAELGKRKRALLGLDWDIVPPRNASKQEEDDAAYARDFIQDLPNFEDVLLDMGDAIGKGFSNLELEWRRADGEWIPTIEYRPQSWFKVRPDDRNELRLRDATVDGAALQPFGWISHIHKAKSGYITRAGLGRVLAWPFLFKNYSVRDLAEFLEIYGLPMRLGTYPSGASDDEKATLLSAVVNIGHAAAGIVPEGMVIDFKESAKGNKDPYEAMMDWCERTQSKAILGGTLTSGTGEGTNTNALGNVHERGQQSLIRSDARQYAGTIGRDILWPLAALNFGIEDRRRAPRFFLDVGDAADLKLLADALPPLVNMGARVPLWWLHEKTRIPQATGKDEILRPTPTTPAPAAPLKTAVAALKGVPPEQEALDAALESLDADTLNAQIREWVEPVLARLESDEDPDALLDYLSAEFPDADGGALEDTLARLIFAGRMWGRLNTDG